MFFGRARVSYIITDTMLLLFTDAVTCSIDSWFKNLFGKGTISYSFQS